MRETGNEEIAPLLTRLRWRLVSRLLRLLGRAPRRRAVLYTAGDCRLCERARSILRRVAADLPLTVTEVDVGSDPALWARYRHRIPVLWIDERLAYEGKIR